MTYLICAHFNPLSIILTRCKKCSYDKVFIKNLRPTIASLFITRVAMYIVYDTQTVLPRLLFPFNMTLTINNALIINIVLYPNYSFNSRKIFKARWRRITPLGFCWLEAMCLVTQIPIVKCQD